MATSTKFHLVLLIDDNPIDNLVNQKLIERANLAEAIMVRDSAVSAIEYLKSNCDKPENIPDTIFLDIRMPEMDGFQFLEEFDKLPAEVTSRVTIYMLSSSIDPKDISRANDNKYVAKFLTKPLSIEKLPQFQ
jgi:CheY-like chemotaxis protein